jgi:signal transduction histidine kinase
VHQNTRDSAPETSGEPQRPAAFRAASLRFRLPVLIFGLLAATVGAFAWMAHREVKQALRLTASERVAGAARQVADLLAQSAEARAAEPRQLAGDPQVHRMLRSAATAPQNDLPDSVEALLRRSQLTTVFLYDAAGRFVRSLPADSAPPPESPFFEKVGPLLQRDGRVWYHTSAPIDSGTDDSPIGYVSIGRSISAAATAGLLERLLGSGSVILLGNAEGGVWTDLSGPVPGPPLATANGSASYVAETGQTRLGAAAPVDGTPWLVWVDISEAAVLAPARTLVRRMLPVAAAVTLLAALAVYALSARVTTPLTDVADAAEAIAAGDYSRRVSVARRDEIGRLGSAFNVMAARVAESHETLEARVRSRTIDLENANRELEAFSYSVSHDLRTPLRSIDGFAQALVEDYWDRLDDTGRDYLSRIRAAAQRMGALIDDLLSLSRVSRAQLRTGDVDLSALVREIAARLQEQEPDRRVDWRVEPDVLVTGDASLLRVALDNLLGNAWKFTAKEPGARIEFARERLPGGGEAYVVRDNGAGFDMAYASKLFGAFQRLHPAAEFPGTGVGLAIVQRAVRRHGGRVWADARVNGGATFSFTLWT